MTAQVHQIPAEEPPPPETQQPSLEQLIQHSRDLIAEGVEQARDISELAFMELELAVATSKWLLLAGLLLGTSSLLFLTFMMAALAVLLIDTVTPAAVLLLCGLANALCACILFFWIKSLSRKMLFRALRQQLRNKDAASRVEG